MPPILWYILVGNYMGIPNIQKYMECVGYMWRNPVYQTFQTHKLALKNFDKSLTDTLEKEGKLQKRSGRVENFGKIRGGDSKFWSGWSDYLVRCGEFDKGR